MQATFQATIELIKKARHWLKAYRAYVVEVGLSAFVATSVLALIMAALEYFFPGSAAPYISPQVLIVMLALSGALVLWGPDATPTRPTRTVYAAIGLAAAAGGFWAAWYYFATVAGAPAWLPWMAGLAAGLPFWTLGAATIASE